jgi:hypothetical protein
MITLGLNAAFHDSAAVLVVDGVPVAAAEEERFTRIKHAKRPLPFTAWELPFNAAAWCLEQAGITLESVDHVAYSLDPALFAEGRPELAAGERIVLPLEPSAERDPQLAPWESPWDPLFLSYVVNAPRQLRDGAPHHLRQRLYGSRPDAMRWRFHHVPHHLCHQASAFLAAPFDSCAVMTLDGRGERATSCYGVWRGGRYRPLGEVQMPHSLGLLYERATSYLGFLHSSDEYKVMALAAMGTPRWAPEIGAAVRLFGDGQFEIGAMDFEALAGPARVRGAALEQRHLDLAASLQAVLILGLIVVFTRGGDDQTAIDTGPVETTTTTRALSSTTTTTRLPVTTTTVPPTTETSPSTTTGGGGGGGGGTGGGGGGGGNVTTTTKPPAVSADVSFSMTPGTIRKLDAGAIFEWSVTATGPVNVSVTGPGVSSGNASGSVTVCSPGTSCGVGTHYFTIVVKDSEGRQVRAATAKLIVRD